MTLLRCIDPLSGLLEHKELRELIDDSDRASIGGQGSTDFQEVSGRLLDVIVGKEEDQLKMFFTALKETGQEHVSNFIKQNGGLFLFT